MKYKCPVCGYNGLTRDIKDYALCPCCYTQFGYGEIGRGYEPLRRHWIGEGALWRDGEDTEPVNYDYESQLLNINYHVTEADRAAVTAARTIKQAG